MTACVYVDRDVAERVLEAHYFAMDDPYRAVTNNKGIMNGMDAVAIATGQVSSSFGGLSFPSEECMLTPALLWWLRTGEL